MIFLQHSIFSSPRRCPSTAHLHCRNAYSLSQHTSKRPFLLSTFFLPQQRLSNSPLNSNSPKLRMTRQCIPSSHTQVNMILITPRTRIFHRNHHCISSTAYIIIASQIGYLHLAAAVRTGRLVVHPEVAQGRDADAIGVPLAAGAGAALLRVDCTETIVSVGCSRWERKGGRGADVMRFEIEALAAFSVGAARVLAARARPDEKIWKRMLKGPEQGSNMEFANCCEVLAGSGRRWKGRPVGLYLSFPVFIVWQNAK